MEKRLLSGKWTAIGFATVAISIWMIPKIGMWAQLPVVPMAIRVASSANGPAAFMTNLAEAWEFTTLPTNAVAISWTGSIQQTAVSNGAAATQPSNSSIGLRFSGKQVFTNFSPFSLGGSNYTVTAFLRFFGIRNAGLNVNDSIVGSNSLNTGGYWGPAFTPDPGAGQVDCYVQKTDNTAYQFLNSVPAPMSEVWDFVFSVSNHANGSGGVFLWTNGVFANNAANARDVSSPQMSFIGAGPAGLVALNGVGQSNFIQGIYIQTNYASTLANASNIHYYRTNILTPGASP